MKPRIMAEVRLLPPTAVFYVVQVNLDSGDGTDSLVSMTSESIFSPARAVAVARKLAKLDALDSQASILGRGGRTVAWVYADARAVVVFDDADQALISALHGAEQNGWERAKTDIRMENDDDIIEAGDWLWRDAAGKIRRAYGMLGGSYRRAHTWDATGEFVCGVEARDEKATDAVDLADPAGVHPKWRAAVETYPIEAQR